MHGNKSQNDRPFAVCFFSHFESHSRCSKKAACVARGMVLDLSFNSNIDDELPSCSPVGQDEAVSDAESSISLDALIQSFRSKAHESSEGSSSSADDMPRASHLSLVLPLAPPRYPSPRRSSKFKVTDGRRLIQSSKPLFKPSAKTNPRVAAARLYISSDDSDRDDEEAVKPMPTLTQIPKSKPSLIQIPRSRLLEIPKPKPSVLATLKRDPVSKPSKAISPRSPSPPQKVQRAHVEATKQKAAVLFSSPVPPSQSASSSSSITEDIEPPDSLEDDSIDDSIAHDLQELNRLISSGRQSKQDVTTRKAQPKRSPTSDDMTAALRQSTRFRIDEVKPNEQVKPSTSRQAFPSFKLQMPTRRKRIQSHEDRHPPPDDAADDDSFAEEILKLRVSARKQKETEKKMRTKEPNSPEAKEISAETTANIREVSNAIDQVLLLALQPFEKRRRDMDIDDATAANESIPGLVVAMQNASLPLATQAIVENLDLAFSSMTQQRNAELKADKDAEAAAKVADEATKNEANAKKMDAKRAEKQRQAEILSLLPMKGKLMTSSADVDDALYRLELAETQASNTIHVLAGRSALRDVDCTPPLAATGLQVELAKLRQRTQDRIEQIEHQLQQPAQPARRVNWELTAFESKEHTHIDNEEHADKSDIVHDNNDPNSFHDILQRQVVENLDLTMLKLRHVLGIDVKEAAAAREASERKAAAKQKQQLEDEREKIRKTQEAEDAENARKRVMGLTSLDQLGSWIDEATRHQQELSDGRAADRLISSLGIRTDTLHQISHSSANPSGFVTRQALEQFDTIKEIKEIMERGGDSEKQHLPDLHDGEENRRQQQRQHDFSVGMESPQHNRHRWGHDARVKLEFDDHSSDENSQDGHRSPKHVQFNHDEPEDDTSSFETLFQRFHGTSLPSLRSKRIARYVIEEELQPPSPPSQERRSRRRQHEVATPLKSHSSRSKTQSAAPRHRTRPSPTTLHSPLYAPSSTQYPSSSVLRHAHGTRRKSTAREPAPHLRKTISSGSALVDHIQQQITRLQADRRQKDAWVSQRVA